MTSDLDFQATSVQHVFWCTNGSSKRPPVTILVRLPPSVRASALTGAMSQQSSSGSTRASAGNRRWLCSILSQRSNSLVDRSLYCFCITNLKHTCRPYIRKSSTPALFAAAAATTPGEYVCADVESCKNKGPMFDLGSSVQQHGIPWSDRSSLSTTCGRCTCPHR